MSIVRIRKLNVKLYFIQQQEKLISASTEKVFQKYFCNFSMLASSVITRYVYYVFYRQVSIFKFLHKMTVLWSKEFQKGKLKIIHQNRQNDIYETCLSITLTVTSCYLSFSKILLFHEYILMLSIFVFVLGNLTKKCRER